MIYVDSLKNKIKLLRKRPAHRARIFLKYLFQRRWKEPVFVIATRRSGSNLLCSYLNSVPQVDFAPEILNPCMYYGLRRNMIGKKAILRHIAHSLNDGPGRIGGAKLLALHLAARKLSLEELRDHFSGARFIILYRQSVLAQLVSLKIAEKTSIWQCTDASALPSKAASMHISSDELKGFSTSLRSFYGMLLSKSWLREFAVIVSYEELQADPQQLFDSRLFPFLGLESFPVSSRHQKQNNEPLEKIVENYDELKGMKEASQLYSWVGPAPTALKF